jgi:hypothetical protein
VITAAQRAQIRLALGKEVMDIAEQIHFELSSYGRCNAAKWRDLIQTLWKQHPDLMETPQGAIFTYSILGRFDNGENDDAGERHRRPGGGFPGRHS